MNRIGVKLVCLAASIVIWIQVASTTTTEATLKLPLEIVNLPAGTTLAGSRRLPASVGVRLRGSKLRLLAHSIFKREAGRVLIDLDGFEPGAQIVLNVVPEYVRTDLVAEVIVPSETLNMRLDRVLTRVVPVVIPTTGSLPADRQLQAPLTAVPDSVRVTGPERFVVRIDSLRTAPLDLSQLPESPQLRRDVIVPLEYLEVDPRQVEVRASVARVDSRILPNVVVVPLVDAGQSEVWVSPPIADLLVRGPADSIRALVPARVALTVPAGDLRPGNHRVRAQATVPDWVTYVEIDPEFFTVVVGSPPPVGEGGDRQ